MIVTDIYSAGEKPLPGITGALIAQNIVDPEHKKVKFMADMDSVPRYLGGRVKKGDLVLTLGAGDVWKMGKKLVEYLQA